ncbi:MULTISPECIES: hypothetical protein [unclassified Chryseobacterium]|uniref:hypothetical protein n=1 Tax=unclassified Chryseobacterium TaxID=2593645 RepID=UPI000B0BBD11|nr:MULTISPECIES: hypothetical protein [unclassified Chryseobacterium]
MIKKIITQVVLLTAVVSLHSCQHILDQAEEKRAQENFTSEFMGKWTGTYYGDLSGNLTVNVAKNASAEVSRSASGGTDSYWTSLIGSSFNTTVKSPQGFIIYGNLQNKAGTWEMGTAKGTWTLMKN